MKEKLFKVLEEINDEFIEEATVPTKRWVVPSFKRMIPVVTCVAMILVASISLLKQQNYKNPYGIGVDQSNNTGITSSSFSEKSYTLYNGKKYMTLSYNQELADADLLMEVSEDMLGRRIANLIFDAKQDCYIETKENTNIALYECLIETEQEVLILYDGGYYLIVPVVQ